MVTCCRNCNNNNVARCLRLNNNQINQPTTFPTPHSPHSPPNNNILVPVDIVSTSHCHHHTHTPHASYTLRTKPLVLLLCRSLALLQALTFVCLLDSTRLVSSCPVGAPRSIHSGFWSTAASIYAGIFRAKEKKKKGKHIRTTCLSFFSFFFFPLSFPPGRTELHRVSRRLGGVLLNIGSQEPRDTSVWEG